MSRPAGIFASVISTKANGALAQVEVGATGDLRQHLAHARVVSDDRERLHSRLLGEQRAQIVHVEAMAEAPLLLDWDVPAECLVQNRG